MKLKNYALLCLVALLAATACKKNGTPKPDTTGAKIDTDVYIAGTIKSKKDTSIAVYWKNGVLTTLSDSSKNCYPIGNIIVNGSDVYVAGAYHLHDGTQIAVYWKNGQEIPLNIPNDGSVTASVVNNITVNNNSVYVAGTITKSTGDYAAYWKDNDLPVSVSAPGSNAYAVAVNGTEVVLAGGDLSGIATYWKGSTVVQSSKDGLQSAANAMIVNGSDIYTAGNTYHTSNGHNGATYWINGIPTYITYGSTAATANAIALQGQDVFTAGDAITNNKRVAFYWKNDEVSTKLNDEGAIASSASGIAVIGNNDTYLCGSTGTTTTTAVYWKNGKMKTLPRGTDATGIAVVTNLHQ